MSITLIVTFDKSNEDIPVLCVSKKISGFLMMGQHIITGDKATEIWEELSKDD